MSSKFDKLYKMLLEKVEKFEDFKIVTGLLSKPEIQTTLHKYASELEIFRSMIEKENSSSDSRMCDIYFDDDVFVGFTVYGGEDGTDYFKFDENKKLKDIPDDPKDIPPEDRDSNGGVKSAFETIHLFDVEVCESSRKRRKAERESNTKLPTYGTLIINAFLEKMLKKYDGVTLQAFTTDLLGYYNKTYGFINLNGGGNAMVKWK